VVVGLLPAMAQDLKLSLAEAGRFVTWFSLAAALLGPPLTMLAGRRDPELACRARGRPRSTRGNGVGGVRPGTAASCSSDSTYGK
ncbi:MAG: MFS transporter, partial [Betaproteobacteria bacterium]|nr:MFS transporter [Betaproteobacteria bacterium]